MAGPSSVGHRDSLPRTLRLWHLLLCCLFSFPAFSEVSTLDVSFPHIRDTEPGGAQPLGLAGGEWEYEMPQTPSLPSGRPQVQRPAQEPPASRSRSPPQGHTCLRPAVCLWARPCPFLSLSCLINCKPVSLYLPAGPSYFLKRKGKGTKQGCLVCASSQHRWVIYPAVCLLCLFWDSWENGHFMYFLLVCIF